MGHVFLCMPAYQKAVKHSGFLVLKVSNVSANDNLINLGFAKSVLGSLTTNQKHFIADVSRFLRQR